MAIELKVPQVGESITEVQIGAWLKQPGERVEKDEIVVEIETDKATVELPAPVAGIISRVMKDRGEVATVGEVIGIMEESADGAPQKAAPAAVSSSTGGSPVQAPCVSSPAPAVSTPPPLPATPAPSPVQTTQSSAMVPSRTAPASRPAASSTIYSSGDRAEEHVPMTMIRRRIAERLVSAHQNAALLTTFNEIDMSSVIVLRKEAGPAFQEKFGAKLGFMSFFVKAVVEALKLVPQVNAEIRDNHIIYHNYYDIGIAVGGGKGLVVPVVRNAERLSFAEIELKISELAARARDNKIAPDELEGGTFTISNGGIYGSLLSTPIVNPPQSGILGLHAIQDRPIALDGQVVIRPMMYIALTYDHRLVDGREAVTFLRRIKEIVENPLRMLLEV